MELGVCLPKEASFENGDGFNVSGQKEQTVEGPRGWIVFKVDRWKDESKKTEELSWD